MKRSIRIGLLGCGTVGQGVLQILHENATHIHRRLGANLDVAAVVVRDPAKPRGAHAGTVSTDPSVVLDHPDIDVVVELMGGVQPAGAHVRRALAAGKSVVTANKALLAEHGHELIELAESKGVDLYFEAAVAGGIPVIRVLREALAADRVKVIRGIVNGTSNYILSRMQDEGMEFADALALAQKAGYAEADPTLDVSGGDAAHKLTILATLAFGARIQLSQVTVEGITEVDAIDIRFASRFGYVIKSLCVAKNAELSEVTDVTSAPIELRVHPALVDKRAMLASVSGALNAVHIEGALLGPCFLSGYGAGGLPTGISVVSDIIDVGRNLLASSQGRVPQRAFQGEHLVSRPVRDPGDVQSRHYVRLTVEDKPGVLAKVAGILGAFDVSIEQMVQEATSHAHGSPVTMVMFTHDAKERNVRDALREIASLQHVVAPPRRIRIDGSL
jgi:homoserine dehydrogenase